MHEAYGVHKQLLPRAVALLADGLPQAEVARTLNVHRSTVSTWVKRLREEEL